MRAAPEFAVRQILVRRPMRWPELADLDGARLARLDRAIENALPHGCNPERVLSAATSQFTILRHPLSDHFLERSRRAIKLRSHLEENATASFPPGALKTSLQSRSAFDRLLLHLANSTSGQATYRTSSIGLCSDGKGVQVRLPSPAEAHQTIGSLYEGLRRGGPPGLCAAAALLMTVNAHPFEDGNGRVARALANMTLRLHSPSLVYVPFSEIFHRSDGGYEIALRGAEINGDWNGFIDFLTSVFALLRDDWQEATEFVGAS
jgi:hypothetical protein